MKELRTTFLWKNEVHWLDHPEKLQAIINMEHIDLQDLNRWHAIKESWRIDIDTLLRYRSHSETPYDILAKTKDGLFKLDNFSWKPLCP